jgi:membrane fusion protein (multidrug efflux system)
MNGIKIGYLVAILLAMSLAFSACENQTTIASSQTKESPPAVGVVEIQPQPVILTTKLPGRTAAFRFAEIRPQVSGLILKRLFNEGSDVKADQALYQIDPAPFQAVLDNAEASMDKAKAQLFAVHLRAKRYRELLVDKAISEQDYDDAVAAEKQAKAEIKYWKAQTKTARINLNYTKITAPISGRIGRSKVTDGAIVTAYQPTALANIQQLDPIYVDVPQSTTELLRLKRRLQDGRLKNNGPNHGKVKLVLEDDISYPLEGTLQFSDVTVDPTTGSVILRVVFPNPEALLLPGMFVQAVLKEGVNEQALLVPQPGVSRDTKGNPFALIVDDDSKVALRPLTLDRALADKWLVLTGLDPGDQVIVEGLKMLRPGMTVQASPFQTTQTGQDIATDPGAQPQKRSAGDN